LYHTIIITTAMNHPSSKTGGTDGFTLLWKRAKESEARIEQLEEKNRTLEVSLRQAVTLVETSNSKQANQQKEINYLEQLLERQQRQHTHLKEFLETQKKDSQQRNLKYLLLLEQHAQLLAKNNPPSELEQQDQSQSQSLSPKRPINDVLPEAQLAASTQMSVLLEQQTQKRQKLEHVHRQQQQDQQQSLQQLLPVNTQVISTDVLSASSTLSPTQQQQQHQRLQQLMQSKSYSDALKKLAGQQPQPELQNVGSSSPLFTQTSPLSVIPCSLQPQPQQQPQLQPQPQPQPHPVTSLSPAHNQLHLDKDDTNGNKNDNDIKNENDNNDNDNDNNNVSDNDNNDDDDNGDDDDDSLCF